MTPIDNFIRRTFRDVRSKKRTTLLHEALVTLLVQARPELAQLKVDYEYKHEDVYEGFFSLDIIFFNEDDTPALIVLAKAPNSCITKNIYNAANTTIGEAARCQYGPRPANEVLFITVAPRVAPIFHDGGKVKGYDNVDNAIHRVNPQVVLSLMFDEGNVNNAYILYDIVDVKERESQDEFMTIEFENLEIPDLTAR